MTFSESKSSLKLGICWDTNSFSRMNLELEVRVGIEPCNRRPLGDYARFQTSDKHYSALFSHRFPLLGGGSLGGSCESRKRLPLSVLTSNKPFFSISKKYFSRKKIHLRIRDLSVKTELCRRKLSLFRRRHSLRPTPPRDTRS